MYPSHSGILLGNCSLQQGSWRPWSNVYEGKTQQNNKQTICNTLSNTLESIVTPARNFASGRWNKQAHCYTLSSYTDNEYKQVTYTHLGKTKGKVYPVHSWILIGNCFLHKDHGDHDQISIDHQWEQSTLMKLISHITSQQNCKYPGVMGQHHGKAMEAMVLFLIQPLMA